MDVNITSTRLRFISASNVGELTQAVSSLPFKVELKSLVFDAKEKRWYQTFVLPDFIDNFNNVEL